MRLLGGLEARSGDVVIRHFVSRPIASLLARLALQPRRQWSREELVDMLWPGAPIDVGRNRLRNAISLLRRLLEPPGAAPGSVLIADRRGLQLATGATRCDAVEFERSLRERRHDDALAWYGGELLPGFYDDWVLEERARLADLRERLDAPVAEGAVVPAPHAAAGPPAIRSPLPVAPMPPAPVWRSLPSYLTGFFGREAERARALEQIAAHRLVSVIGLGGAGKTRLAVEVAAVLEGVDLVVFVPLADCLGGAQVVARLRVALQLSAAGDAQDAVVAALAGRRALLVLDNCEQLPPDELLGVVALLLERLPLLRLVVTSRRALGHPGERELLLAPLPRPDPADGLADIARNPSVALFIDRARGVRPDFQVTERNREALASFCVALEGLPLALELAASRSRAFTPKDLLAAFSERFSLLARPGSRARAGPLRHDSLHAAIGWSWALLSAREQRFLAALSVFRGGCTAAAAAVVCEEPEAARLLEGLTGWSLLQAVIDDAGSMRFGMLEMIRVFVLEGIDPGEARRRRVLHRRHLLALASAGAGDAARPPIDRADLPNVVEALRSALDDGEPGDALRLGLALRHHWERDGIGPDALPLLREALARTAEEHEPAWVEACTLIALLLLPAAEVAEAHHLVDVAIERSAPGSIARAAALCAKAKIVSETRRHGDALGALLDEALALARRHGDVALQAQCLSVLSLLTLRLKRGPALADAYAHQARALYESIGHVREASALRFESTLCLLETGRLDEALAQVREFEAESVALGDRLCQLKAINQQGVILASLRRWSDALTAYGRCVRLAWEAHNVYWLTFALWNHGRNLARLRDPARAALLMAFSEHHWTTHFGGLDADERRFVRQVRRLVRAQVGAERLDALWREGRKLPLAQAVRLALPETGPGR